MLVSIVCIDRMMLTTRGYVLPTANESLGTLSLTAAGTTAACPAGTEMVEVTTDTGIIIDGHGSGTSVFVPANTTRFFPAAAGQTFTVSVTGVASSNPMSADTLRSTATRTVVASSATSQTLIAANPLRKGLVIFNTDANALHVNLGADADDDATTADLSIAATNGVLYVPYGITNRIPGIWAADGSGQATIYEAV
jgi:hypothetical protein